MYVESKIESVGCSHLLAGDPALNRAVLEPLTPQELLEQASGVSFLSCVISAMAVLAEGGGLKGLGLECA